MKKSIFIVAVFCLIALLTLSVSAYAEATKIEQQIAQKAQQNEKIVRAACVVYKRDCVVCVQTKNMTSKTEYNDYVADLKAQIKADFEIDNVYVCANPKVMRLIDKLQQLDEKQREEAIKRLIDAEKQRRSTGLLPLPTALDLFK